MQVTNPLGGIAHTLRILPPCGHVAGLISRLDRDRGAHHTPANASLFDAVDLERDFIAKEQVILNEGGINLLRCFPGRGIPVWGGRTLARESTNRFIGHRRLIHRLVPVIRRVADPLGFYTNGPYSWLTLGRPDSSSLLHVTFGSRRKLFITSAIVFPPSAEPLTAGVPLNTISWCAT